MDFEPLDQYLQRRKKLTEIEALGHPAYPHKFDWTHTPRQVVEQFGERTADQLEAGPVNVRVAGRILALRPMGKAGFAHLAGDGGRLQIYVRLDVAGEQAFKLFQLLDLGDIIGVWGHLFRTKTNELTVKVEGLEVLNKALLPLPEKWHGLADTEQRYRRRYLDLIVNERTREIFLRRAQIIRELRRFFDERGYSEVETPMMHPIVGGATARPFVTHHNTFDMDLYLRIAPELYLKRLVVGGLDRVYEINRNFRNEGIDAIHQPEFTMLEFYQAYSDAGALRDLTEELFRDLAQRVCGTTKVKYGEGEEATELDFGKFTRLSMHEAILKHVPTPPGKTATAGDLASKEGLRKLLEAALPVLDEAIAAELPRKLQPWEHGTPSPTKALTTEKAIIHLILANLDREPLGRAIGDVFEAVAERYLVQPTFIYDFPVEISPLAKRRPDDPSLTERFELFVAGMEIANGFSELNDPIDQESRFRAQVEKGGVEAPKEVDVDYIRALSHGLPPTAGEGVGIDRVVMLLTNSHAIREVILFPLLRGESAEESDAANDESAK
ncbi:MAG TPA: lysine--tRNA ligase [Candidatus Baltobacteraceae bacterium]|nr:lysine--tRNA ligase [Candidatus Baltobacteraceae bacterium]